MGLRVAFLIAALALVSAPALAQTGDNVLLVVNTASAASTQIADHYIKARHIPEQNIVRLKTTDGEYISRPAFDATIEEPIALWLSSHQLQDQILYIVLTKGIPLRVDGTAGLTGTVASVDSELTLLYRKLASAPVSIISHVANPNLGEAGSEGTRFSRTASDTYFVSTIARADTDAALLHRQMVGESIPIIGRIDNPYFLGDKPVKDAPRFSRLTSDIYLVTRLDGYTVDDVLKLIDRGASPVRAGQIVLDQQTASDRPGEAWLAEAARRVEALKGPVPVQLESTRAAAAATGPVLGYFSWGSNDPANLRRTVGLPFANGAIGGLFVSTDARTFKEPPPGWRPSSAASQSGGQSLIGDLIREGITGISGSVAEPFLDAIIRPQVLFPAYLSGFNLAESFYMSMPFLSWQDVVIGDPLCAPFSNAPLTPAQIDKGIDAETGLPAVFAERRLALLKSSNFKVEALKLFLKATILELQSRPEPEIRALLTQATAIDSRLTVAHLILAQSAEARGDFDEAISRYRIVVGNEPDNAVALNNLAYALAEKKDLPKEALPLAELAYRLTGQAPIVADTLGWIHFKLGDVAAARTFVDQAVKLEATNVDILVHAAAIHLAQSDVSGAKGFLEAALKADPKAAERPDVKALAARIR